MSRTMKDQEEKTFQHMQWDDNIFRGYGCGLVDYQDFGNQHYHGNKDYYHAKD